MLKGVPVFSVVIPLYNKERYVRRCLDSILAQRFADFEVVVVDDGSTDDSTEIVAACNDPRLRLIRQANGGVSAARNRGIAEARAEWIAFLDADDEYLPGFLDEVRACIELYPMVGGIFARSFSDEGNETARPAPQPATSPRLIGDYDSFLVVEGEYPAHTSSVAVKRDVFKAAGLFPLGVKIGEDTDMWMRVGWVSQFAYINKYLAIYHVVPRASGWESSTGIPYWLSTCQQWISENRVPQHRLKSARLLLAWGYLNSALGYGVRGNIVEGRRLLHRKVSLRASPKALLLKVIFFLYCPTIYQAARSFWRSTGRIFRKR